MTDRFYVVDRIEHDVIVLVGDNRIAVELDAGQLRDPVLEGSVLRVSLDEQGLPIWRSAVADEEARLERLRIAADHLRRLKRRDAGGDVAL